jgi:hypothetical protein
VKWRLHVNLVQNLGDADLPCTLVSAICPSKFRTVHLTVLVRCSMARYWLQSSTSEALLSPVLLRCSAAIAPEVPVVID